MYPQNDPDELTADERRLFAALPRERDPGPLLERRVVSALQDGGQLRTRSAWRGAGSWAAGAIAATVAAIFLGGVVVGQALAARTSVELVTAATEANARQVSLLIQQSGSAYVAALARLAELPDAASDREALQGREVAARLLHAAADELLRSLPDDQLAMGILAALDRHEPAGAVPADSVGTRQVIWF